MRLKRLLVENFRVVERAEVELGPGLNVLYGPNDIGKSTVLMAVRAALLLQANSSEAAEFKPWVGDYVPRVVVELEVAGKGILRLEKVFATGGRHSAKLEHWREGVGFEPNGAGRDVDGKLRELLAWGVEGPGGKSKVRGMPAPFLAKALLGDQAGAEGLLDDSFVKDTSDSGRLRLTAALQAFAQDPRFKSILAAAQKKVDEFFAKEGAQRRGRNSPFYVSAEKIKELKRTVDELTSSEAASTAARVDYQGLLAQVDELSRSVEDARADVAATQARAKAQAALDQAQKELASVDARLTQAEAHAAAVQTLAAKLGELELAAAAAVAEVEKAEAKLAGAKESLRLSTSKAAEQERATKLAQLGEAQAKEDTERSHVEAQAAAAKVVVQLEKVVAEQEKRRLQLEAQRSQAQARADEQRKAGDQAHALKRQLAGLIAYARWHEAKAKVDEAEAAQREAQDLASEIAEANRDAVALRQEVGALELPQTTVVRALVELERQLELARATLGGGLSVAIRAKKAQDVRVVIDGKAESLSGQPGPTRFEAQRSAEVHLGELLEVEVVAGDAAQRAAYEKLDAEWKVKSAVLKTTGAASARELLTKCEAAQARLQTASELAKEAAGLQEEKNRHDAMAAMLESRRTTAEGMVSALEGYDLTQLEQLRKSLKPGWEKSTAEEQKKIDKLLEEAKNDESKAQLEVAAKGGELTQLEEKLATDRAGLELGVKQLGKKAEALLSELTEQLSKLDVRRQSRNAEIAQLEQTGTKAANEAREVVTSAETDLKRFSAARDGARSALEKQRSEVDRAKGEHAMLEKEVAALDRPGAATRVEQARAALATLPVPKQVTTADQLEELEGQLQVKHAERHKAEGVLTQVGGAVVEEQRKEFEAAHRRAEEEHRDLETEAKAWQLLKEALVASEGAGARHVGKVLAEQVGQRLEALTQRPYRELTIDPNLKTTALRLEGADREVGVLSVGTREQLATLLRLAIAESLGSVVVLDDHLVQTDPSRLEWFAETLQKAAEKIQVIVITCRRRDYEGSKAVTWVDLGQGIKRWPWRTPVKPTADAQPVTAVPALSVKTVAVAAAAADVASPAPPTVAAPPSVQVAMATQVAVVQPVAGAASPWSAPDEPWGALFAKALDEMNVTPAQFAKRVGVGTRVVELWLKGTSMPAGQFKTNVAQVLKEGAQSPDSARSRAAAKM